MLRTKAAVCALLLLIIVSTPMFASTSTWNATTGDGELNEAGNWIPGVPSTSDDAVFDSSVANINTSPTTSSGFTVASWNFPNSAQVFNFSVTNSGLNFTDTGITGNQTNTTFTITNTNNGSNIGGNLLTFLGASGSAGSAIMNVINTGTLSGAVSGTTLNFIDNSEVGIFNAFSMSSGGQLNVSNIGIDNSTGTGGNNIAGISFYQVHFGDAVTVGDNVTISFSNSGTNNNTGSASNIAVCAEGQFICPSDFQAGNSLNLSVTNTGIDTSTGTGSNQIGGGASNEVEFAGNFTVGDNATITTSNSGTYSGTNSTSGNSVGFQNALQFYTVGAFQAGDSLNFTITNEGTDSSVGYGGNNIGAFPSNGQLEIDATATVGNNATIYISNTGTFTGSNNTASNAVGYIGNPQSSIQGDFNAGDFFSMTATNTGVNQSSGAGGSNDVGFLDDPQVEFYNGTCTLGNNATLLFSNSGTNSNGAANNRTGFMYGEQLSAEGIFSAGDNFSLTATNIGVDTSIGVGGNDTGHVDYNQIGFSSTLTVGNNATITASSSGTFSGTNSTSATNVGYQGHVQFFFQDSFQSGDSLNFSMTNVGNDSSVGIGGNNIGYIPLGQVEGGTVTIGNNSSIYLSNSGTYTGSNSTSGNNVGYIGNPQLSIGNIQTGDFFNMTVINTGVDHGSGAGGNNLVGVLEDNQVELSACIFGNNATITVSNSGTSSTTATTSSAGYVGGDQFIAYSPFSAGNNLALTVTNSATNTGSSTQVGLVSSQVSFQDTCTLGDGSVIMAYNNGSGSVVGSQIDFEQGFSIPSGMATFQAVNQGTITDGYGIYVGNGLGGNANIVLGNSSLNVNTTNATFTIGQLNGDSTSVAQSKPQLIIATDAAVNANFSGSIQDFPSTVSTLLKMGSGTQKLSGTNTFTGLTTVQEGTLILTGYLTGDVNIGTSGTLKGTGSIAGDVVNVGTIAPGESIGTIYFLSDFANNDGGYAVEVNGAGQSDLISVDGTANLSGGLVTVSSSDGTYKFQNRYTIVDAASVVGTYSGVTAISALIKPSLTYDSQHVYLTLLTNIANAATTANQLAIANQLDGIINPNAQQSILLDEIVDLPLNEAREALDSLSGYQHTDDFITTQIINRQFIRRLYDPLRPIVTNDPDCCCNTYNDCFDAWLDVGGSFVNIANSNGVPGFNTDGYDIIGGVQKTFCYDWTIGAAGSYEKDYLHFKQSGGSEHCSAWLVGLYGLYRPSNFYGLVDFVYEDSSNSLNRSINVGTLHYHAKSNPNTSQYTFYGEIGLDYHFCNVFVQPFFGIEAGSYQRDHVKESFANGWGLIVQKRNHGFATTRLGVHLTTEECFQDLVDISLDLAWNCRLSSIKNHVNERFAAFGTPFKIKGIDLDSNSFDYALTVSAPLGDYFRGYIEGSGESWTNANVFNIVAGVELCW